jgi:very-short-patch-repair endonuclease
MPARRHISGAIGPKCGVDVRIAALAAGQHGVVTLGQLSALGMSESAARKRATAGRLHRIHSGVYAVGHQRLTIEGRWLAATMAYGAGAVLSHRSAAALWGLRPTARGEIDVSVPRASARRRPGIEVHRAPALAPEDAQRRRGIPCTSVARTLLDLATAVDPQSLQRAVNEAETLRIFDLQEIARLLHRCRGRPGVPRLEAALTSHDPAPTRSELERRFLEICRQAKVARPVINAPLTIGEHTFEIDFRWPDAKLAVETDGFRYHRTRARFERDALRDQLLVESGWRVVRFTWMQITREPGAVAARLRRLLAQPRA